MSDRPPIPLAVQRDLLFECRYRCACCCEPVSLEKCHIEPWSKSADHSFENLVVLCSNCHTRSHAEKWPE
jgi:type I restriction enzyme R subunit